MRTFMLFGSMLLLLPTAGCKEERSAGPARPSPTPRVGFLAPEIHGEDTDGVPFKLSDFRGKVVLIDIGAEWCGPCRGFWPHGRKLVNRYKDRPFVMLGVNLDEKRSTAKATFEDGRVTWRSWWDGNNAISQQYQVSTIPAFFIIDAKGVLRGKTPNDDEIEMLVREAEGQS